MTNLSQNIVAGLAAVVLFAATWAPVITVPQAHASVAAALPLVA